MESFPTVTILRVSAGNILNSIVSDTIRERPGLC